MGRCGGDILVTSYKMSEERCASPMGFNHHPVGRKCRISAAGGRLGATGGRLGAAGAEGGREDV